MPKRKSKKYKRPRKAYDSQRIGEENQLKQKYGLKNKKEIWRADFAIERIRSIAKELITAEEDKQNEFIEKQKQKGFEVETMADILALDKEGWLKRRLQTIVLKKGLAKTTKQARQLITHKNIKVNGSIMSSPSHLTTVVEEGTIELKKKLKDTKLATEKKLLLENKEAVKPEEKVEQEEVKEVKE